MGTILFFNGLAVSEGYCPFNLARQNLSLRQNRKISTLQKTAINRYKPEKHDEYPWYISGKYALYTGYILVKT